MDNIYELTCDLTLLAEEIGHTLKKNHSSTELADKTCFAGEDSCCQIDTYRVFELSWRGYITVNIYFFRPELTEDKLQVKFSIFPVFWNDESLKVKKLQKEIDGVIRAHMT